MLNNSKTLEISTPGCPTASVIWIHGLGGDNSNFVPVIEKLNLVNCPSIRFLFPSAPKIPIKINNNLIMSAWYDIFATDCFMEQEDEIGLRKSQVEIEALVTEQINLGIAANKIVIAGFSQGCAMALQTGLRYPEKLAGLICLSGYLPLREKIKTEYHEANYSMPIFQGHGGCDPVIPIDYAKKSSGLLKDLGYRVEWREYATMAHSICMEEIDDISSWLCRMLA
jgi:phospholipase/carboxylesterase